MPGLRFATCNCPVGMKYHALNCPTSPGREQNLPTWTRRARKRREAAQATEGKVA